MRYTHNNDIHPIFFSSKERNKGFALNKRNEKERINEKNMGCGANPRDLDDKGAWEPDKEAPSRKGTTRNTWSSAGGPS